MSILLQGCRRAGCLTPRVKDISKLLIVSLNSGSDSCVDKREEKQPTFVFKWENAELDRLTPSELKVHNIHKEACENAENRYSDPATGFYVFTEYFHRKRGYCCGSGCRHCPYNHKATPRNWRRKYFNSSFYI